MTATYKEIIEFIKSIQKARESIDDDKAYFVQDFFAKWNETNSYKIGDRVRYKDELYKCLLDHTSQADWTPDVSVSLWVRIDDPSQEWPEWKQPTGAHDAYSKGAKVSHNGKHWENTIDTNIYEPGVYGWEER